MRSNLQSPDPAIPGRRGRRRRRGISLLPALFTLGNLLCGFASLDFAGRGMGPSDTAPFSHNFMIAGYFIFLAMIFDMFDGFVARLTRSASDFGAELDSLADMVSFGIAPAYLSIHLIGQLLHTPVEGGARDYIAIPGPFSDDSWLRLFWIIAGVYVACTALRLARFNIISKNDANHVAFRGLPSPGAAALVAASVMFFESLDPQSMFARFIKVPPNVLHQMTAAFPYVLPPMLLVAALLMVSRVTYPHIINRFIRGRKRFRTLIWFFLLVMAILWEPPITILLGIYIYALSGPVAEGWRLISGRPAETPAPRGGTTPGSGTN